MADYVLLFFPFDQTLYIKKKNEVRFPDENVSISVGLKTKCLFNTNKIDENGLQNIVPEEYEGIVIFYSSGKYPFHCSFELQLLILTHWHILPQLFSISRAVCLYCVVCVY